MKNQLIALARRILPPALRRYVTRLTAWPPVGFVLMVGLRRKHPISRVWGSDRGSPVDRYYIEEFVERHAGDVRGRVLEIGTDMYTRRFGGSKVQKSDVLHVAQRRPPVTIIADLTDGLDLESDVYDCIILTQTLNAIYDVRAAIRTVHRVLKPGGVVLTTIPGISKVSSYDMERWGYYWSFTTASARLLFETVFPAEQVDVASYGNVSAAVAFLHGLAWKELNRRTLADIDPDYQLVITVRAVKPL